MNKPNMKNTLKYINTFIWFSKSNKVVQTSTNKAHTIEKTDNKILFCIVSIFANNSFVKYNAKRIRALPTIICKKPLSKYTLKLAIAGTPIHTSNAELLLRPFFCKNIKKYKKNRYKYTRNEILKKLVSITIFSRM